MEDDNGTAKATSFAIGSFLSATIEGPAWLSFETELVNSGLALEIDTHHVLAITSDNADELHRYLIPAGNHTIRILHLSTGYDREPRASLSNLSVEPISTMPIAVALNTPGREWELPGANAYPTLFGTSDGEVVGSAHMHQPLNLKTTVTGPALVSYRWKKQEFLFYLPFSNLPKFGWELVHDGWPIEIGSRLFINGSLARYLQVPLFDLRDHAPVIEPMNPSAPHLSPNDDFSRIAQTRRTFHDGWNQDQLYLGSGEHDLNWICETYQHQPYHWQRFAFSDFKVTPNSSEYGEWASQQWTTTSTENLAKVGLFAWQDPFADPDQDNIINAEEFVYRSNPRTSNRLPQPSVMISKSVLWQSFPDPIAGATTAPLVSDDLKNWRPAPHDYSDEGLRAWSDSPTATKAFFRLDIDVTVNE